jgi:hypothetical protein
VGLREVSQAIQATVSNELGNAVFRSLKCGFCIGQNWRDTKHALR